MRKGKIILSFATVLILALGCLQLTAGAAETITVKEFIPPKYDGAASFHEGFAAVCVGEYADRKWGFIDADGQEIVPPRYTEVNSFSEGFAAVCEGEYPNEKWGFIDTAGQEVVPPKYDQVRDYSDGLAAVCEGEYPDEKWGVIDRTGMETVPLKYNFAKPVSGGLVAVCTGKYPNEKWGFIDTNGQEMTPQKYDRVRDGSEGLTAVCVGKHPDEKWGFVDATGREVVSPKYGYVRDFSEGFAVVQLDGKWGFVDRTGTEAIPLEYDFTAPFANGFAKVVLNGKYGFIDKIGTVVVPPEYDRVNNFSEGMAAVCIGKSPDEKWGFIDEAGQEVVSPKYDAVEDFSEGMAAVCISSHIVDTPSSWGFIDKTGTEVIPLKCNRYVESFSDGLAVVRNGMFFGKCGFIGKSGTEVVPPTYDEAFSFSEGFAIVGVESSSSPNKWGFLKIEKSNPSVDPNPPVNPNPPVDLDPPEVPAGIFVDVKSGDYYYDAVQWAVEQSITAGTDDTHFSPNASCTRAQAVAFLWRAAGEPEPENTAAGFTDVKAGSYYEKAVQWAVEQGIAAGTSATKFSPDASCTRAQIVTFLWRASGKQLADGSSFSDVPIGKYYDKAVFWAVANGITVGTGNGKFSPNNECTRGQIVTFLYRCNMQ